MCSLLLSLFLLLSPEARVSLLTCSPGQQLYARYGHTAIRVSDPTQDLDCVFNYGLFSFEERGFYWHFVQGKTWYQLGVQDYTDFVGGYIAEHRTVVEQPLRLSAEEKDALFQALVINARVENRTYLYNFVFDNCATRPYHLIQNTLGGHLRSSYSEWNRTSYRQFIHHFTRHGSWAEFGINLLFGYKADQPILGEQRMFLPEAVMLWMQDAVRENGEPLTTTAYSSDCHLLPASYIPQPFAIEPVPWYGSWYFGLGLFALVMLLLSCWDAHMGRRTRWVDYVLYALYGLLALLLIFLIFFSVHPLVSIGWRLLIIPAIHLCTRLFYIWR